MQIKMKAIDTAAIAAIWAMRGPAEGDLLVQARPLGADHGWLYEPAEAIKQVRANPGPWLVEEKWRLR